MKLQIILASFFAATILFSCSSDEEITVPDVPDSGIYITEQFEESDLLLATDVPYSIRNNTGLQALTVSREIPKFVSIIKEF